MPGDGTRVFRKAGEYRQDIVEADGLRWVIGRGTNDGLTVNHEMEPAGSSIHDYIVRQFRPGLVFLDIGAHCGHYALRAAKRGCQVYAVEANPESAAQLRLNLLINSLAVKVWSFAAWDSIQVLSFTQAENAYKLRNGSLSLAGPSERNPDGAGLSVLGVPLNIMLTDLDRLDIVKMDVEGADIHVIDGMMKSLLRLRPLLIFECHEFYKTYVPEEMRVRERMLARDAGYAWHDATELGVRSAERFRVGVPAER